MNIEGAAIQIQQQFEIINCYKCGISFAVPATIRKRWIDSGDAFYCPHGHSQAYSKSTVKQKDREIRNLQKRLEWQAKDASNARSQRDRAEARRRAEKAAKTRLKNRVANGVCPCCKRTFDDLQRHMATKHPTYAKQAEPQE